MLSLLIVKAFKMKPTLSNLVSTLISLIAGCVMSKLDAEFLVKVSASHGFNAFHFAVFVGCLTCLIVNFIVTHIFDMRR